LFQYRKNYSRDGKTVTQQSGNQFDDDLTVGIDDSDSFSSGSIDLFEFSGNEESPIAKLKTIILSIDWEINDSILQQLDDELLDLGEIWADDKIKLVYIQGLNKIGRYINKERAGAHPDAIKLLLTFYHNLEKIVFSDEVMSEEEKKQLLLADVKKFDQLKSLISKPAEVAPSVPVTKEPVIKKERKKPSGAVGQLKVLKALVLGIDWEINDHDLQSLSDEVHRLEVTFSQSKAKLILLQGIGALGSYINKMRSKSNRNTFPLLHSLYEALERITGTELAAAEEKEILLSEVSKFNAFKAEISQEKTAPAQVVREDSTPIDQGEPSPAEESDEYEADDSADIAARLDSVFGDTSSEESPAAASGGDALAGVDVETEADDDSEEEALPFQGGNVAPALSDVAEESSFSVEKLAGDLAQSSDSDEGVDQTDIFEASPEEATVTATDALYDEELFPSDEETVSPAFADVSGESSSGIGTYADDLMASSDSDEDEALVAETDMPVPGVDVETEADDDSEEKSLPFEQGELAPALAGADEEYGFDTERIAFEDEESPSDDLEDRLGAFFDDEVEASSEEWGAEKEPSSVEIEEGIIGTDSDVSLEDEEPVKDETEEFLLGEESVEEATEEALTFLDEEETGTAATAVSEEFAETVADEVEEQALEDEKDVTGVGEEPAEITELPADDEPIEKATEEALSFLDEDDVETTASEVSEEYAETVVDESEEQELTDESDVTAFEEPPVDEESIAEATEEALSFFDQEEDIATSAIEDSEEEKALVDDDSKILDTADTIEFSVPGEAQFESTTVDTEEKAFESDAELEFDVPGEAFAPETALFSGEDAESEEVVFIAVGDDVEVDPLPGEQYVDDEGVEFLEASDEAQPAEVQEDNYTVLASNIEMLHDNVTEKSLHNIYDEVNRLRNSVNSSHTDKIFLQLLSTAAQHIEKDEGKSRTESLSLLDDIFSGLEMDSSTAEEVQQHLLECTSKVLLLQKKDM
jgi:pilus assembly protein FimV